MTERAALYLRVSSDGQADGTSLDTQEAGCRRYSAERGFAVVMVEVETESGATLDRPGLDRVRAAVAKGEVDTLVVFDLDRLSRSQNHLGVLFCEIEETHGARVESVTQDLNGQAGLVVRTLAGLLAEMEREKIRERTMRGRKARIAEGHVPTTGFACYGYAYVQPTKEERALGHKAHRVIVHKEAAVVREVFKSVAAGVSLRGIASSLNARGIPSPGTRLAYDDGRQPVWQLAGVKVMVRNPAYCGLTVAGRFKMKTRKIKVAQPRDAWTVINADGPAIVEPDLWQLANDRLTANRGAFTRNQERPMLLRGRIVCGVCGTVIYADADKRDGRRAHYRCRVSHGNGQGVTLVQEELDEWVWSVVEGVLHDRDRVVDEIRRRLERQGDGELRSHVEGLEARVARVERQRAALLRSFTEAEGTMPWATIQPEVQRLDGEHAEANAALAALRERLGRNADELARLDGLDALVRRLGPRLIDPDHETRVRVVTELNLTVRATRLHQQIEWSLPLADGEESGWGAQIDLSGVKEPDEGAAEGVRRDELAEACGVASTRAPVATPGTP